MRIAIAGIMHESNSFSSVHTVLDDFTIQRGEAVFQWWAQAHHEMGGYIAGASTYGYDLVPLFMANATPSGPVTASTFESLVNELLVTLKSVEPVDGLLLALHGAMVSENYRDGDGEILHRLREATGPDFPIIVTHDLHANVSEQAVAASTALIIYKTYPHIDQRERGLQAAEIMVRTVGGEVTPVQAMSKPPMVLNIVRQFTSAEPVKQIMQAVRELENHPKVLSASLAESYQYADVFEMGPSFVVVTDNEPKLAEREAQRLADLLWYSRDRLTFHLPTVAEAVAQAIQSEQRPVVLVDMGDNIGGGSAGDSTFMLAELLAQQAESWLVVLADAEAVQSCMSAGVGADVSLVVGGKTDDLHGNPIQIHGRVKSLHDGRYIETEARHGGQRYQNQGLSAVVEIPAKTPELSSFLVLTTNREPPFSLQQLVSLGITPQRQHILTVKAAIAFRTAYEPIAGEIIEVDSGGLTAVNPSRFTYQYIRPNLWGLEL